MFVFSYVLGTMTSMSVHVLYWQLYHNISTMLEVLKATMEVYTILHSRFRKNVGLWVKK